MINGLNKDNVFSYSNLTLIYSDGILNIYTNGEFLTSNGWTIPTRTRQWILNQIQGQIQNIQTNWNIPDRNRTWNIERGY
jgi:hypothetical protein